MSLRPPRVYYDMDDCLASFVSMHDRLIGYRMPDGDIVWEEINKLPTFFLDLPVMARAQELWDAVAPRHRYVLSSYSKHNNHSREQKRQWIHDHFPLDDDRIILVRGKVNKVLHCQPGDVLIDDWHENISQWTAAGGIGILYTEDRFDECIAQIPAWALFDELGFCALCRDPAHNGPCRSNQK